MPYYESVFLARPDITAEQAEGLADTFTGVLDNQGGKVVSRENWGLRNLTYRIKKNRKAHYIMLNIDAPGPAIHEMERQMRFNEDVMRYLTIKVDALETDGDHYDPQSRTIALSPDIHDGKSLTAVVVAAHEVGHALQHKTNYGPLHLRWRMAKFVAISEKVASVLLVALPFVMVLTRIPIIGAFMLLAGIAILALPVLFHLITLPVELDASFNRALPILRKGQYLPESAMPAARKILTAAALTYVAASLASLLNFYRWIAILRR